MFTGLVEGLGRLEQIVERERRPAPDDRLAGPFRRRTARARRERGRERLLPDRHGGRGRDVRGTGRARDTGPNQPGKQDKPAIASTSSGHSR